VTVRDKNAAYLRVLKAAKALEGNVGVGWFQGQHPSGFGLAELAAVHEYGSGRVPARAPLAVSFDRSEAALSQVIEGVAGRVIDGELTAEQALDQIGSLHASQIQNTIAEGLDPPNSTMTVEMKGSSTPLIDTGRLRQSVTWARDVG